MRDILTYLFCVDHQCSSSIRRYNMYKYYRRDKNFKGPCGKNTLYSSVENESFIFGTILIKVQKTTTLYFRVSMRNMLISEKLGTQF